MISNSCPETLRGWRTLYKAALAKRMCKSSHYASKRPAEHSSYDPESYFNLAELRWRERSYRGCHVRAEGSGNFLEVEHTRSQTDLEGRLTYNDASHLQRGVARSVDFLRMIATTKSSLEVPT